jgi:hypothetical protein
MGELVLDSRDQEFRGHQGAILHPCLYIVIDTALLTSSPIATTACLGHPPHDRVRSLPAHGCDHLCTVPTGDHEEWPRQRHVAHYSKITGRAQAAKLPLPSSLLQRTCCRTATIGDGIWAQPHSRQPVHHDPLVPAAARISPAATMRICHGVHYRKIAPRRKLTALRCAATLVPVRHGTHAIGYAAGGSLWPTSTWTKVRRCC